MGVDRRKFIFGLPMMGLSGCSQLTNEPVTIRKMEFDLVNSTSESQKFFIALESTEGLGEWHSYEVSDDSRKNIVIKPFPDREWVKCHGFVNEQALQQELIGLDTNEEVCLKFHFNAAFEGEGDALLWQAVSISC